MNGNQTTDAHMTSQAGDKIEFDYEVINGAKDDRMNDRYSVITCLQFSGLVGRRNEPPR